ncbi:MAG TPA: hypothetical protein VFJ85_01305 [Acidimicrobiales bacterium]|nr:hypothetical protein [Acidimicrobiales bacterium]
MTTWWSVSLSAAGGGPALDEVDERLVDLAEALEEHAGVVSSQPLRYGARLSVQAPSAGKAVETASRRFREAAGRVGLPSWPVVSAEAVTEAELEAELEGPTYPKLMGVTEVAEALGTSRQRVSALARQRRGLPPPLAQLASGPVWSATTLRRFINEWDRRPGRPAKVNVTPR